ncbi:MAG TPA: hypothetical protein VFA83_04250 [Acidimicrobiales bacterium]|nr:hypothetical protein [Acidimicrobiales bacterium]
MARTGWGARALGRAAVATIATSIAAQAALVIVPLSEAGATTFTQGNLLVSTSIYKDVPTITAGSTVLPLANSVTVSGVASSGAAPNIVATITTAKNAFVVGQTVVIASVGGATQVNGTFEIASIVSTTKFTISMGSTAVSAYTSGGTVTGNIAIAGNQYPAVFNNASVDANFGVTEPIVLDEIAPTTSLTTPVNQVTVPNSDTSASDQLVTSFPSKSEIALNQSTDGSSVSFMGYNAHTGALDVSNSNTPVEQDPTNTDTAGPSSLVGFYRDVATMDGNGNFQFTESGAYGGNNGRAAFLNSANNTLFMAGNAGNGANPPFQGVVIGSGSQIAAQASTSQAAQESAGVPAPVPYGNFNITQTGNAADKSTKDDNFRGLTQFNGVAYMSKGSGSNGINTVYFVDTTGQACPAGGVGLPQAGASLPSAGSWPSSTQFPAYSTSNATLGLTAANPGLSPANMCVLKGFPTTLASAASGVSFPFGMWFANPTTLYVADEGSGKGGAGDTTGGLQKWVFNAGTGSWSLAYTIQNGLNIGTTYSVNPSPAGVNGDPSPETYPTGSNTGPGGTGKAWAPATDGLRNIAGRVNGDGTVTVWATTSTISGSGDQGADPNQLVAVTDTLSFATGAQAAAESFSTVLAPTDGVVYRGVSFTPNTASTNLPEVPWAPLLPAGGAGVVAVCIWRRSRRRGLALA